MYQSKNLTEGESSILRHISMWGSDGYPVQKIRSRWHWVDMFGVKGAPVVYKTKREAVAAFELFHSMLLDKLAGRL